MNPDSTTLIAVIAAGSLFFLLVVGVSVFFAMRPRMRLKKRMEAIGTLSAPGANVSAKAETRRQKRIQDKLKTLGEAKEKESIKDKIGVALLQAGLQIDAGVFFLGCLVAAAVGAAIPLMLNLAVLMIPVGAILLGLGLPKFVLSIMAKRRQSAFTANFAEAIDVITRGIRSGLPVGECLSIIAREFPGPVGEEFTALVEGQRLGMTLEAVMSRALKRIPTADFKFFAIVLQIQKQTGGSLADTLENLSDVLRGRKRIKDKIQALSSEAKASAYIIGSLPFVVLGLLYMVNREYVEVLFGEGIHLVYGALGLMALGAFVMREMINFEI